jgi:hypothetical protein
MKPLIEIINTDNSLNIIEEIMSKEKPKQIDPHEWIYKGCFIQEFKHPQLKGKYEVFKNNVEQTHIDRCNTFTEAKRLCEENECFDNVLKF